MGHLHSPFFYPQAWEISWWVYRLVSDKSKDAACLVLNHWWLSRKLSNYCHYGKFWSNCPMFGRLSDGFVIFLPMKRFWSDFPIFAWFAQLRTCFAGAHPLWRNPLFLKKTFRTFFLLIEIILQKIPDNTFQNTQNKKFNRKCCEYSTQKNYFVSVAVS